MQGPSRERKTFQGLKRQKWKLVELHGGVRCKEKKNEQCDL